MKLNDVATSSIIDIISKMNLKDIKIHTDDNGNIVSVELKYIPVIEVKPEISNSW